MKKHKRYMITGTPDEPTAWGIFCLFLMPVLVFVLTAGVYKLMELLK